MTAYSLRSTKKNDISDYGIYPLLLDKLMNLRN